jgi:hypothetical protein
MKAHIAVPCGGWVHMHVAHAVSSCMITSPLERVTAQYYLGCEPDPNRNRCIDEFLTKIDAEYLLFIDADNPPLLKNPLDYAALDKDVIIFPTPIWKFPEPPTWNIFDVIYTSEGEKARTRAPGRGLEQVDAGGAGCILIHRRVLERVKPAFVYKTNKAGDTIIGGDINFCLRAKKNNFKVWCAWDCPCSHYKDVDLRFILDLSYAPEPAGVEPEQVEVRPFAGIPSGSR